MVFKKISLFFCLKKPGFEKADLKIPAGYKVVDDSKYWIRMNFGMSCFESKRQLLKILPDHEKELNAYITKNNVDFKKNGDVIELVRYCNELFD